MAGITITANSGTQFEAGGAEWNSVARLDDNTFVIAYADSNDLNYGKVVVGTRNGTTITMGSILNFHEGTTKFIEVVALTSSLIVISYEDKDNGDPKVIAGTISGTTITLGSEVAVVATTLAYGVTLAKITSTTFVVLFGNGVDLHCYVGSVSGTTITMGSVQSQLNIGALTCKSVGLANSCLIVAYQQYTTNDLEVIAGKVDVGVKTISFGAVNQISSIDAVPSGIAAFGDSMACVLTFFEAGTADVFAVAVVTDPTTLATTEGSEVAVFADIFSSDVNSTDVCSIISTNSTQFAVVGYDTTNSILKVRAGNLTSSTVLTLDAQGAVNFQTVQGVVPYVSICNLGSVAFIIAYKKD